MILRACAKTYFVVYSNVQMNDEATIRTNQLIENMCSSCRAWYPISNVLLFIWFLSLTTLCTGVSMIRVVFVWKLGANTFQQSRQTNMFNYTSCKLAAKYSRLKVCELWSQQYQMIKLPTNTIITNIAKGTTDPRVEFISQVQTQILIKFLLQNLDQASTSKSQPNISLSIKFKLQNLD